MTITIPPDLADRLAVAAAARGTTPEWVAFVTLINAYPPPLPPIDPNGPKTLLEFLGRRVGAVSGNDDPLSDEPNEPFAAPAPATPETTAHR